MYYSALSYWLCRQNAPATMSTTKIHTYLHVPGIESTVDCPTAIAKSLDEFYLSRVEVWG